MEHPGKLIYDRRRALRMSRRELVERSGVGKTALYDVEHGKSSVQLDTLEKVCGVLGIRIQFLPTHEPGGRSPTSPPETETVIEPEPAVATAPLVEAELPDHLL